MRICRLSRIELCQMLMNKIIIDICPLIETLDDDDDDVDETLYSYSSSYRSTVQKALGGLLKNLNSFSLSAALPV